MQHAAVSQDRKPVAVIDIGSNSVRLVVYEGRSRSPTPLFNEKALCGLGRTVAETGRIDGDGAARTLAALRRFRAISEQLGAGKAWTMATAAVREAENGREFIAEIERQTGLKVMLLSGEREAEMAAAGVMSGFHSVDGLAGDLGGGSLELMDIGLDGLGSATTLKLGGLRLMKRANGDLDKAEKLIDEDFQGFPALAGGRGRQFYAIGGTWRAIAKLHMDATDYPLQVTHGYEVAAGEVSRFCSRLAKAHKSGVIPGIGTISNSRREVIPLGALVLKKLIERAKPREVVFSVFGIREGLLYTLLPEAEKQRDPLLTFCEEWARLRSRSAEHARELCDWTDQIFVEPGPEETADERRLRHAACLISDISWRAHPDYRGVQSLNIIANSALGGLDHAERAFLALAVYYRHVGSSKDEQSSRLNELVSRSQLKRARIVGAAVRAAHMLSIGMAGVISRTSLQYEKKSLVLRIPSVLRDLDGERLTRRFSILRDLLGVKGEIRFVN